MIQECHDVMGNAELLMSPPHSFVALMTSKS
jgi:hypothetical protein